VPIIFSWRPVSALRGRRQLPSPNQIIAALGGRRPDTAETARVEAPSKRAQAHKLRQPVHGLSTRATQESNTPQPSMLRRSGKIDNQKVARIVIPIVSGT
jgi:hypothetical protein